MYFNNCFTPEDIHALYRYWAKRLHPDAGGSTKEFQDMQNEYESVKKSINSKSDQNTMPNYFNENGSYEYFRRKVKYVGVYFNHYYKFVQDFGADILIDIDHVKLIFVKQFAL